jgi:hypothetical protein
MIELTEGSQMRTNASGSLKTEKPNIIPHGQEKKMTEKEHLECEIKELQLEIEEKAKVIGKLKNYLYQREHQLKKMNDAQRNTNEAVENKMKEEVNKLQVNNWKVLMQNADYPMLEVIDENTVRIEGVEYKKVEKEKTPTIYEFLTQCAYGEWNPELVDTEIQIQIETNAENFVNYLYEYCDVIEEDDDKMIVSISKTQMVIPNL